jgi:TATA-box binding protein (TBP) (component of TFIID and TFIIIB)
MVKWKITNIQATAYFNTIIRVDQLAESMSEDFTTNYNPDNYPGFIIYHKKFSAIIFRTGSIKVTGINKIENIFSLIEEIRNILKKYNINLPDKYTLKIANIHISGKFDYNNIDIERMGLELEDAFYDPERFPAVTVYYKIFSNNKAALNIFKNGSFVGVGFKCDIKEIIPCINYVLNEFQENVIKKFAK